MAQNSKIREFPDISTKLTAPTKKSLFERQKAEAEAKRQREQQETAAVYEDFIKSFDDADDNPPSTNFNTRGGGFGSSSSGAPFAGPSKRHFSGPPTGPSARGGFGGGRGPGGPGSLGPPPPSVSRKRAYDGSHLLHKDSSAGLFAFEDSTSGPVDAKVAFQADEDDEDKGGIAHAHERAAPKPTLRLSFLPPGTSPAVIKALLPPTLTVDAVRILPTIGTSTTERRSYSAIVTLAKDTPAVDIDTAVNALQNRYLGRGFYLTLSRYLSSAVDLPPIGQSPNSSLPFGARPIPTGPGAGFGRGRPGGSHRGGFAPPQSYAPSGPAQSGRGAPATQVVVTPPSDLNQLKLIHKTLEALLTHGPEFEALLMSRKDIQSEEKWAWLWDSRSQGGVYYRWRLWDILSGGQRKNSGGRGGSGPTSQIIFEGGPVFVAPEKDLRFEFITRLEEFVSDSDYDSSDEDDSGDEARRRHLHFQGGAPPPETTNLDGDDQAYLNPFQKARLTHLLARLPTTNAKLRRGDVARVTAFAIEHAGEGAEEVVEMITLNVQRPFAFSGANPDYRGPVNETTTRGDEEAIEEEKKSTEKEDTSSSKLIGLFIISDILSSSSTSGIRHAWRYRQLFEAALRRKQVFERLGRLEKVMHWGRMRAEKWKRSVLSVLTLWEGWCVFPQASQEHFTTVFTNPPLTAEEEAANAAADKASAAALAAKSRWKTVDEKAQVESDRPAPAKDDHEMDSDFDGEPMGDDEDLDGEPMDDDEDVDGEPMVEEAAEKEGEEATEGFGRHDSAYQHNRLPGGKDEDDDNATPPPPGNSKPPVGFDLNQQGMNQHPKDQAPPPPPTRRRRPKAEDMFADSDGE
jgi:U2-associated protein SR140